MATIYTEQSKNVRRTWGLMTIFLIVVVALGYFASYYFGNPAILYGAVIFSLLMNIFSYWQSDKIALSLSKAVPADPVQYPDLHNIVENLAITAGLPKPRVYIIHDQSPNAFATGRDKEHSAVAVTDGLLKILDRSELEGVIAHELAHIGNRDILLATIVVMLVGFVSLLADFFLRANLHGDRNNKNPLAIVGVVLIILSPIIAKLIQLAISRKREFLADATAVLLTRYPEGLARALQKIEASHQPLQHAHQATAHLFIANPFTAKSISNLFSTHPRTEDRVKAILNIDAK